MKNNFLILGIILLSTTASFAIQKVYLNNPNSWGLNIPKRTIYNPYSYQYRNPYTYQKIHRNDAKRIQRLNRIRHLNRIKNNLTWNLRKNYNGSLTGYSTPINQDVFRQINIKPYNSYSNNLNTNLYSMPNGNDIYYRDGRYYKNLGEIGGKTGATIIYD